MFGCIRDCCCSTYESVMWAEPFWCPRCAGAFPVSFEAVQPVPRKVWRYSSPMVKSPAQIMGRAS